METVVGSLLCCGVGIVSVYFVVYHLVIAPIHNTNSTGQKCWDLASDIRGLSNDNSDGNENSKKAMSFWIGKTTTLHVHHAFLNISYLLLHNYNTVKPL